MAAFHSMAHRMTSIPMSTPRYEAEKHRIIEVGRINSCPRSTTDNIIERHELEKQRFDSAILFAQTKNEETKRVVLPYLHRPTNELAYIEIMVSKQLIKMCIVSRN